MAALDRCLSVPGGAVLLCGPSGSGRRSLLQLVAHAQGLKLWCTPISRCAARLLSFSFGTLCTGSGPGLNPQLPGSYGFVHLRHMFSDGCLVQQNSIPGGWTWRDSEA